LPLICIILLVVNRFMEKITYKKGVRSGAALIIAMLFVMIFAALSVSLVSMSGTNIQIASNQQKVNQAYSAAQSGLECARRLASSVSLDPTSTNTVTDIQAEKAWTDFRNHIISTNLGGKSLETSPANEIRTQPLKFDSGNSTFQIRFYLSEPNNPRAIKVEVTGRSGEITRKIGMDMTIQKDASVLQYAIASRGRMWITGDSTIHGDIYSSWNRTDISPFNMTNDSRVEGTINTVLNREDIENAGYFQFETLDENGLPMDVNGNPLGTNYEDRFYGPDDEIQGYHKGINYDQLDQSNIPGMRIGDYDTSTYRNGIPSTTVSAADSTISNGILSRSGVPTVTEYFPHAAGDYNTRASSGSQQLTRYVYVGKTLSNIRVSANTHALFQNCVFEGVLYIDCSTSSTWLSNTNNIRFDNCTFKGTIVTNVPTPFNWQRNALYFTGEATFNNQSIHQEATILAPHFNVDLGNTNPEQSDDNTLKGAIVGGIVDVRGNAQIEGTIISMFDTSAYSSGFVTNIGATLDDGGSETTELGDIGTIEITPDPDNMLPSGISSRIVIKPKADTYYEGF